MNQSEIVSLIISLVQNIAILAMLAAAYRIVLSRAGPAGWLSKIGYGVLLGVICIVGMKTPMQFEPGIIFDGRSIILSVGGLFGGPVTAMIGALIAGSYRWLLGGPGWRMGVAVTMESALLGILFHGLRRRGMVLNGWTALGFSFLVHVGMLALTILLPAESRATVFRHMALPILTIYPLGGLLLSMLFLDYEKKEAQARHLQLAEERYRTTLLSIGEGVIVTDREGRIELLNPVAEACTGWTLAEARGRLLETVFHIVNEETRRPVENPVAQVLRKGGIVGLANHTLLIGRDGTERAIADAGAPIRDDMGNIKGVVIVFRDQTEQRAAERRVEEARILAENIVDTAREAMVVLDAEMKVVKANQTFYHLFGGAPENIEGHSLFALAEQKWNIPELKRLLRTVLPQNTAFNDSEMEAEIQGRGRRILLLNARQVYHTAAETKRVLLAIEDVTERRRAEQALRNSEQRYRRFIDASDDLIFIKDSQFRYVVVNEANARFFKRAPEDVVGRVDFELMPEEVAKRCRETDRKALEGEGVVISIERVGGSIFETRKFRVELENGEMGVGGVIRDVTDRERAMEEVRCQLDELRRWQAVTVGREERVMELKKEVNALAARLGEPPPYA